MSCKTKLPNLHDIFSYEELLILIAVYDINTTNKSM